MPLTFSHPAIVLPLTYLPKRWISLTGLVIGSLTPDFEYFLRMRIQSNYSHTINGLFWFDLPLGIMLSFVFHNLVRDSLFDNLPQVLKSRLSIFKSLDWNKHFKAHWIVVSISILIGAFSHILWDGFTHPNGYFVVILPSLTKYIPFFSNQIPIFKVLQHASSMIGGLVIIYALWQLPSDANVKCGISLKYWILFTVLTLTVVVTRLLIGLDIKQYGNVLVTGVSAGFIALILTPILIKKKRASNI